MKTILITGGSGFIGHNFIKYLLNKEKDINIINFDKLTYSGNINNVNEILNNNNYKDRYKFIQGDICDLNKLREVCWFNNIDGIINFAAETHVDRSFLNSDQFMKTNILGVLNLLFITREFKINRFLQISTDEVYGSLNETDLSVDETAKINPSSPYSLSKATADQFVLTHNQLYKIDVVITRCSNNYGPYQYPEKFIPLCISNALNNKEIPIYGNGEQIREWIYVEDHCEAIWLVFNNGKSGEIYNIGSGNQIKNIDIVKIILNELNKDYSLIKFVNDRPNHDFRYALNCNKIKEQLNWECKILFNDGIKKTIKWYLDNRNWLENIINSNEYKEYYNKLYNNR